MVYGDEKNIALRASAYEVSQININKVVTIDGKEYSFAEKIILDNTVKMILPANFSEMDRDVAQYKYPSEFRPELILTNTDGDTNITFNFLKEEMLKNSEVEKMTEELRMASKRLNPSAIFMEYKIIKNDNLSIGFYEYRGSTFSDDVYILKFILSINNRFLLGGLSCLWEDHENWSILIKQMLHTIQDLSSETNNQIEEET